MRAGSLMDPDVDSLLPILPKQLQFDLQACLAYIPPGDASGLSCQSLNASPTAGHYPCNKPARLSADCYRCRLHPIAVMKRQLTCTCELDILVSGKFRLSGMGKGTCGPTHRCGWPCIADSSRAKPAAVLAPQGGSVMSSSANKQSNSGRWSRPKL